VRPEPVLRASEFGSGAPDDWAAHFYGTVLNDNGKFRMWYYACHWGKNPDWPPRMMQQIVKKPTWAHVEFEGFEGPICYAESDDGINWTKPQLWQVLFKAVTKTTRSRCRTPPSAGCKSSRTRTIPTRPGATRWRTNFSPIRPTRTSTNLAGGQRSRWRFHPMG